MAETFEHPFAITMWDFSWLERRWPGAGYENWDLALDELVERGITDDVIFNPQNGYTKRLLADVPDLKGSLKKRNA